MSSLPSPKYLFILVLIAILNNSVFAITYTTAANGGNWNAGASWDANGVPPGTLPNGDFIIVNHDLIFNVEVIVLGTMTINAGGSITGLGMKLKIGKGGTNQGELINYGDITIDKLKDKAENGCNASDSYPVAHNYGNIFTDGGMHIGNNCGSGGL